MSGTEFREDTPHEEKQFGRYILVIRKDVAESLVGADGDYTGLISDALGRLHAITTPQTVANSIKVSPVGGAETVDASGTAQPLVGASTIAQMIEIKAMIGNTGAVYVGDSSVDKTTSQQITLLQDQSFEIGAGAGFNLDINEIYIDADNTNDGVNFLYYA